ncbi:sulfatase-like hydrolase/transferase [Marinifilum fragile]
MKISKSIHAMWPVVLGACATGTTNQAAEANQKPNVIVVVTDDQGYGQLNFDPNSYSQDQLKNTQVTKRYTTAVEAAYNAAQTAMPNTSQLANEGIKFTNAFVASTTCAPSRAALLTGKYTQRFGIYNNYDAEAGVRPDETFLSETFQENGYKTAMIGKWHLGELTIDSLVEKTRDYHRDAIYGCVKNQHPLNKGFDYYYGFNYHGSNYYNATSLFRNYEHVKSQGYITEEFTDEALQYIEKNQKDPFFIYLSYNAPHIPLEEQAPRKYQRFNTGNPEVDNYYATLAAVDEGIGQIVAKLKELKLDKNTMILFVSDNGAVVDSPLPLNGAFKGNKGLMFQGGIHVPMFAWYPGKYKEGKVITDNVSAMDLLPTALAEAGIELPKGVDGIDLNSVIRGENKQGNSRQLFWAGTQAYHWSDTNLGFWSDYEKYVKGSLEITTVPSSQYKEYLSDPAGTVLEGDYMMHYYPVGDRFELFHIKNDPGEENNLAAQHPEKVKSMKAAFNKWITSMEKPVEWKLATWKKLLPKS